MRLANDHFTLEDFLNLKDSLIETGYISGKAVGMLLTRQILMNRSSSGWHNLLEPHDSFYIGSGVFYTYIVQNGWWKLFMEDKMDEGYYSLAETFPMRSGQNSSSSSSISAGRQSSFDRAAFLKTRSATHLRENTAAFSS